MNPKLREDRQEAAGPNEVWALDFVHDRFGMDKKLRILTVVDTRTRRWPVDDPRVANRRELVVQNLDLVCDKVGYLKALQVGNRSEFISRDLDLWPKPNV